MIFFLVSISTPQSYPPLVSYITDVLSYNLAQGAKMNKNWIFSWNILIPYLNPVGGIVLDNLLDAHLQVQVVLFITQKYWKHLTRIHHGWLNLGKSLIGLESNDFSNTNEAPNRKDLISCFFLNVKKKRESTMVLL